MDSSVVTALMAEESAEPVRTFSIGFENGPSTSCRTPARSPSSSATVHTEEVVRLDAIETAAGPRRRTTTSRSRTRRRSRRSGSSQIAAQHLKVVLTGDGGDESFGGYLRYRAHAHVGALDVVPGPVLRSAARLGHARHRAARRPVAVPAAAPDG